MNIEYPDLGGNLNPDYSITRSYSSPSLTYSPPYMLTPGGGKYDVRIGFTENGINIMVGCKTFSFNDIDEGMYYLKKYISNPEKTEEEFNAGTLFTKKSKKK